MEASLKIKKVFTKKLVAVLMAVCVCTAFLNFVPFGAAESIFGETLKGAESTLCVTDGNAIAQGRVVTGANATYDHYYPNAPTFKWSEDGTACTATFTCKYKDGTKDVACDITETVNKKATTTADGKVTYVATVKMNGKTYTSKKKAAISKVPSLSVGKSTATYTGKLIIPDVRVKDASGEKLSRDSYIVSYNNNKGVGIATVVVELTGDRYSGTLEKTFKILPAATKVKSTTAAKKAFTVKWKKAASDITGYQVRYSTSEKFSSASTKTVKVKSASQTSTKVTGLKAGKTYYVQVRAYTSVDGKNYYSAWSDASVVVTK